MPFSPDDQLVQRLQAREPAAMTVFYDRYGPVLYRIIWRIVRDEGLAEDVLQEAMLKIWAGCASYDPSRGRVFTWALNVCRHAAIDQLRTRQQQLARRTEPLAGSAAAWRQASGPTFNPDHVGVRELVAQLPPRDRGLVDLLFFGGLTHVEAAAHLQLPLGTVKTRVRAALRVLAALAR
ncbi:RNA polymerase sigma factor [Hymenobacter sp. BT491]|uniref:RNA polymerase sigma factor n=1 Tax=Hymenobacter sp. BT491 TaxID=2766779 RepID=UPI00165387F7|nr:sigma-70 family RNA polymerase sigma factor [Hymenobacter sp. BT491]MBC6992216.1 sigma-70 family RNA polymerase sigma factor [Hymenobacter sp. BT491]